MIRIRAPQDLGAGLMFAASFGAHADMPKGDGGTLRLLVNSSGTQSFPPFVIKKFNLDKKYGFVLESVPTTTTQSSRTAIQGGAADIIKRAMIKLPGALKDADLSAVMLLQVHDELVFESPMSGIESLVDIVRNEMQRAMELSVPLVVDVAIGLNWLETESVQAKSE